MIGGNAISRVDGHFATGMPDDQTKEKNYLYTLTLEQIPTTWDSPTKLGQS